MLRNHYFPLIEKLNRILRRFNSSLCNRCYGSYTIKEVEKDRMKVHHSGEIHSYIKADIDTSNMINIFFSDIDHGLFHGMMTAIVAQIISFSQDTEKLLSSCVLHDFLKTNGYSQETHDKLLVDYFPNLLDETYTHSNPPESDLDKKLIIGDRLELRRYSDYKNWVDGRFDSLHKKLNKKTAIAIDLFYEKIRPALKYFYENKDKIYIRHGLEKLDKKNWAAKALYPPKDSYWEIAGGYPIELDQPPFSGAQIVNRQGAYCSNHGEDAPFNQIKGFISFDDFLRLGGEIIDSKKRDHLYANSNMPIESWIFIHRINNSNRRLEIEALLSLDDVFIIHQETLTLFFALVKLLTTKITVLNQRHV